MVKKSQEQCCLLAGVWQPVKELRGATPISGLRALCPGGEAKGGRAALHQRSAAPTAASMPQRSMLSSRLPKAENKSCRAAGCSSGASSYA